MFLLLQMAAILISYVVLYFAFPWFFRTSQRVPGQQFLRSIFTIVVLMAIILAIAFNVPNDFWANRIQHAFLGAFIMSFICFRAVKDTGVSIDPIRFFLISGMLVTTLGVTGEMLEFFFHSLGYHVFSYSIEDTWWDLLSNAVGATIGGLLFAPFIPLEKADSGVE